MLRVAPRNLIVASTALAGLMSAVFLSTIGPAAASDASYCHAQFRACLARYSTRTCDARYDYCLAYSAAPAPSVVILGIPRFHRRHKDDPKTDPKIPPKPGPIGNPVPKAPTTGTNAPGGPKTGGSYTTIPGGWHATTGGGRGPGGGVVVTNTPGGRGGTTNPGGSNAGGGGGGSWTGGGTQGGGPVGGGGRPTQNK